MTLKAALPRGPQDAREHVLGDGAARRAIAAATHLPRDHRPADRVFSPGMPRAGSCRVDVNRTRWFAVDHAFAFAGYRHNVKVLDAEG